MQRPLGHTHTKTRYDGVIENVFLAFSSFMLLVLCVSSLQTVDLPFTSKQVIASLVCTLQTWIGDTSSLFFIAKEEETRGTKEETVFRKPPTWVGGTRCPPITITMKYDRPS